MNSGVHQQVAPKIKRSLLAVRLLNSGIILLFTKIGILPFYSGVITAIIIAIETTVKLYVAKSHTCQNCLFFFLSLSPIWMLYFDSCDIVYTQILTLTNVRNLVFEENRKKYQSFFYLLTIASWLSIIFYGRSFLDECPHKITDNLPQVAVLILTYVGTFISALTRQIDTILSELKQSLASVKELNSKLEGLNDELKQSLQDRDNFILLFSHETRNPLNILLGNLALLLGEVENVHYKTKLEQCKFCADLLLQQLTNILDSGKLSMKGNLELSPTPVNIQEYIQSISSFMEMLVKKKGTVRSELIIPETLPAYLEFDMQRFTQVCLNLLTNGLKFTESGTLSLVIQYLRKDNLQESDYYPSSDCGYRLLCSLVEKSNASHQKSSDVGETDMDSQIGYKRQFTREIANLGNKKKTFTGVEVPEKGFLKIEINDTGCGITPEHMKKLFKKFSQTHADAAQLQVGSGLGLWITKTLCNLMGGDVKAYSAPNIGSCFVAIIQADCLPSVRPIPLTPPSQQYSQRQAYPNSLSWTESDAEAKRILLVDDDPFNLEFHTQIIKSLGYDNIETAMDGLQLVEQFKTKPEGYYEAVVTDISMPNLDGIAAAKLVRKFEEEEKRTTIVKIGFITGHSNYKDKLICEKTPLNCSFYLSKPIKLEIIKGYLSPMRFSSYMNSSRRALVSPIKSLSTNTLNDQKTKLFSQSSPLILCVDDDIFNLDFLEEMLRSLGVRTLRAKSGEESLTLMKSAILKNMKENIPKLVLMDCSMPKMDGWTASKLIKEMLTRETETSVKIVGISGDDKGQNQEKLKHSGMDEILQKPIQKEELQKLIIKYT